MKGLYDVKINFIIDEGNTLLFNGFLYIKSEENQKIICWFDCEADKTFENLKIRHINNTLYDYEVVLSVLLQKNRFISGVYQNITYGLEK